MLQLLAHCKHPKHQPLLFLFLHLAHVTQFVSQPQWGDIQRSSGSRQTWAWSLRVNSGLFAPLCSPESHKSAGDGLGPWSYLPNANHSAPSATHGEKLSLPLTLFASLHHSNIRARFLVARSPSINLQDKPSQCVADTSHTEPCVVWKEPSGDVIVHIPLDGFCVGGQRRFTHVVTPWIGFKKGSQATWGMEAALTAARISAWASPVLLPVSQKYKARNIKDTEPSCTETEVISAPREACLCPHLLRARTAGHPGGLGSPAWALTACGAQLVRTQSSHLAPADPAALLCTGLQIYGVFCHLIKDAPAGASMAVVQGGDDVTSEHWLKECNQGDGYPSKPNNRTQAQMGFSGNCFINGLFLFSFLVL